MEFTSLLQLFDKFQQAGKIDNLQQVSGVFGCTLLPLSNVNVLTFIAISSKLNNTKDILMVGVAMGQEKIRKQFNSTLRKMVTSDSTLFNSDFVDLDKILDKLVDASCTPYKPGKSI